MKGHVSGYLPLTGQRLIVTGLGKRIRVRRFIEGRFYHFVCYESLVHSFLDILKMVMTLFNPFCEMVESYL